MVVVYSRLKQKKMGCKDDTRALFSVICVKLQCRKASSKVLYIHFPASLHGVSWVARASVEDVRPCGDHSA